MSTAAQKAKKATSLFPFWVVFFSETMTSMSQYLT